MNRKLILFLSLFGLAMGLATLSWITSGVEPFVWLAILIVCTWLIVENSSGKFFMHGFLIGILQSVWMTIIHLIFFDTYMSNHAADMESLATMPIPYSPRIMILMTSLPIGALSGVILGLLALGFAKLRKK